MGSRGVDHARVKRKVKCDSTKNEELGLLRELAATVWVSDIARIVCLNGSPNLSPAAKDQIGEIGYDREWQKRHTLSAA